MKDEDQLPVLICKGRRVPCWLGVRRREPFSRRERAIPHALVPAPCVRLDWEAVVGMEALGKRGIAAALDSFDGPALIVSASGVIVHANQAGTRWVDLVAAAPARLSDALAAATWTTVPLQSPGLPPHHLVLLDAPRRNLDARLAVCEAGWKLTPRETEILGLLVRGKQNADISAALGCALRTTEKHVSSILDKAECGCRTAITAWFWDGADASPDQV